MKAYICILLCTILLASLMLGGCSLMAQSRPQEIETSRPTETVPPQEPPETEAPTEAPSEPEPPTDTAAPTEAQTSPLQSSATETVTGFAKAYFARDTEAMYTYLTDPYEGYFSLCPEEEATELADYRGLETAGQWLEEDGMCVLSLPFRPTPEADSFMYLSLTLVAVDDTVKISDFGLEG